MIYRTLYRQHKRQTPLLAGIIGPGHYGTAIMSQSTGSNLLRIPVAADRQVDKACTAYRKSGVPESEIVVCGNVAKAQSAMESGKYVVVEDPMILMELSLDVIVESTGNAEAGACHALAAIRHGKHVAMVNKETDSAVGPILQRLAKKEGLVYTQVDGDHPGLLIGLIDWAKSLGLEIVAAGKSRDVELALDRRSGIVTCAADGVTVMETQQVQLSAQEIALFDDLRVGEIADNILTRRNALKSMPRAEGYDLCELQIVANACGLAPDVPELHNPILRTSDIPKVLCPREEGGILAQSGAVDVIDCFRDRFEGGLAGAVFVVVSCASDYSRGILVNKGLVANDCGKSALIYRPYHLCGVETLTTILCAGLANIATGSDADAYVPRFDIVRTARTRLNSATVLGNDHDESLVTSIVPANTPPPNAAAPAHLLHNQKLLHDVEKGELITYGMVAKPDNSILWNLRAEQDAAFSSMYAR